MLRPITTEQKEEIRTTVEAMIPLPAGLINVDIVTDDDHNLLEVGLDDADGASLGAVNYEPEYTQNQRKTRDGRVKGHIVAFGPVPDDIRHNNQVMLRIRRSINNLLK